MADRVEFLRLEHHQGPSVYNYMGKEGYSVPAGGAFAVTFQVTERDGSYIQMTEIIQGPFPSFDQAVDRAYLSVERRLLGFGKTGEELKQWREKRDAGAKAE